MISKIERGEWDDLWKWPRWIMNRSHYAWRNPAVDNQIGDELWFLAKDWWPPCNEITVDQDESWYVAPELGFDKAALNQIRVASPASSGRP